MAIMLMIALALSILPTPTPARAGGVVTNCTSAGLDAALAGGGTITFNCNGNNSPSTIGFTTYRTIAANTTINGTNGGNTVSIVTLGIGRVFSVTNGINLTLTNLNIRDGYDIDGGCIYTNGALVLNNVLMQNCVADTNTHGGAIYVSATGSAVLTNSNILSNTGHYAGGGIYNLGILTVTNSYIAHNTTKTTDGGGIWTIGNVRIDGSTFYGNTAQGYGGGIYNQNILSVTNSTLDSNYAGSGGGGSQTYLGKTALQNVNIISNTVPITTTGHQGGGLLALQGTLTVTNSTIKGNKATLGGGIGLLSDSNANLTNVTLEGNIAGKDGGGIYIYNFVTATINNSTVSYNVAYDTGGGIFNGGNVTLMNATLSSNRATYGGGLISSNAALLTNATLYGNLASLPSGNGIFQNGGYLVLRNTIFANAGLDCFGVAASANYGNNIDDSTTCNFGSTNGSMSNTDPKLGPLANNGGATKTHALLSGSPAINGVTYNMPNFCPFTDQRGFGRFYPPPFGNCDIGAYEYTSWTLFLPLIRK